MLKASKYLRSGLDFLSDDSTLHHGCFASCLCRWLACTGRNAESVYCGLHGDVCLRSCPTHAATDRYLPGLALHAVHHYGGQLCLLHWFLCAHHSFTSVECGRSHATMQRVDYNTNIRCISWELLRGLWLLSGRHCVHNVVVLRSHCVSAMPFNWAVDSRDETTSRCQTRCQQ